MKDLYLEFDMIFKKHPSDIFTKECEELMEEEMELVIDSLIRDLEGELKELRKTYDTTSPEYIRKKKHLDSLSNLNEYVPPKNGGELEDMEEDEDIYSEFTCISVRVPWSFIEEHKSEIYKHCFEKYDQERFPYWCVKAYLEKKFNCPDSLFIDGHAFIHPSFWLETKEFFNSGNDDEIRKMVKNSSWSHDVEYNYARETYSNDPTYNALKNLGFSDGWIRSEW